MKTQLTLFGKIMSYLALLSAALITILPFLWMITTALKSRASIYTMPPTFLPEEFHFQNFIIITELVPILRYLFNSVVVAFTVTLGTLITSLLAAFAFSYLKFPGRNLIFYIYLATLMVPGEVTLTPNFVTLARLGWLDTYKALIFPWLIGVFAIFLLRQHFLSLPREYYDYSIVEGCSKLQYIWKILIPLSKPILLTIVLLKSIYSWNAFLWPLLVTNSIELRTLPVGISAFLSEAGSDYHLLMAYSLLIILPILFLYLLFQKQIIKSLSYSGLEG